LEEGSGAETKGVSALTSPRDGAEGLIPSRVETERVVKKKKNQMGWKTVKVDLGGPIARKRVEKEPRMKKKKTIPNDRGVRER